MACVLDTNVLVYDTLEDAELHEVASKVLGTLDRWLLPSVVFEEYVFVLEKLQIKRRFIAAKVSELLHLRNAELVPLEKTDIAAATEIISRERVPFRNFNDKLILSVAKRRSAMLFTFDSALDTQRSNLGINSPLPVKQTRP